VTRVFVRDLKAAEIVGTSRGHEEGDVKGGYFDVEDSH
jgi:hypothetical protein